MPGFEFVLGLGLVWVWVLGFWVYEIDLAHLVR